MKVLVVGGVQFVGAAIVSRLLDLRCEVSLLSLDPPTPEIQPYVRWLRIDRNDEAQLKVQFAGERFQAVVDNIAFERSHVEKLAAALPGRIDRYVLTSTVDVYGHNFPRFPREFDAPDGPTDLTNVDIHQRYPVGKRGCEAAVRELGIPWCAIRPGIVVGGADNVGIPAINHFYLTRVRIGRALFFPCRVQDGGPILLRQDDHGVFRLAPVDDVARAVVMATHDIRMSRRAFNVVSDEVWTSETLVREMCHIANQRCRVVRVSSAMLEKYGLEDYTPPYLSGTFWSTASNTALKELGWSPTPGSRWIQDLLSSRIPPILRAGYGRRAREIALAYKVERLQSVVGKTIPTKMESATTAPCNGRCTAIGSQRTLDNWPKVHPSHVRQIGENWIGSIGIGTFMGAADDATDDMYRASIDLAIRSGFNVVDTAINYRGMRAERVVGDVLRKLSPTAFDRFGVLVSTKGGFIPHDSCVNQSPERYINDTYVRPGLISMVEALRSHSINPKFISFLLSQSLRNLGLETIDVYFLHNPELARQYLGEVPFFDTLEKTIQVLETHRYANKIVSYGLATWDGLLVPPEHPQHLSLERIKNLANAVAGGQSGFSVIQLPFNIIRQDAAVMRTQLVNNHMLSVFEAARELGLSVMTSGSLGQGVPLADAPLPYVSGASDQIRALQFTRSAPQVSASLVGMRNVKHVEQAVTLTQLPTLEQHEFECLLKRS